VIPLDQARRVLHAANEPKTLSLVPRAGHNDLFEQGAWGGVRAFLETLQAEPAVEMPAARAGRPVELVAAADADR
jgi:hypothetical protein